MKGVLFSIEMVLVATSVLVLLGGLAIIISNANLQPDAKQWPQTKSLINTQTRLLTNSPMQGVPDSGNDYYCYTLWGRVDSTSLTMQPKEHCEETP